MMTGAKLTKHYKTLRKHISCDRKCKLDRRKYNSNQKCSNDKSRCECKNPVKHRVYQEHFVWNLSLNDCEINRCFKSFVDDLATTFDENIDVSDTVSKTLNDNKAVKCKVKRELFYFTHFF